MISSTIFHVLNGLVILFVIFFFLGVGFPLCPEIYSTVYTVTLHVMQFCC